MNALTISLDIKGTCRILGKKFDMIIANETVSLSQGQQSFSFYKNISCTNGWNSVYLEHIDHPNDLTVIEQENIIDYSTVSFDVVKINGYEVSNNMCQRSGTKCYNPITDKQLTLYDLGEPFKVEYKFYYPLEYWTFALATSKANWGKMGWKHG